MPLRTFWCGDGFLDGVEGLLGLLQKNNYIVEEKTLISNTNDSLGQHNIYGQSRGVCRIFLGG